MSADSFKRLSLNYVGRDPHSTDSRAASLRTATSLSPALEPSKTTSSPGYPSAPTSRWFG
jgi:hypothetical protein